MLPTGWAWVYWSYEYPGDQTWYLFDERGPAAFSQTTGCRHAVVCYIKASGNYNWHRTKWGGLCGCEKTLEAAMAAAETGVWVVSP